MDLNKHLKILSLPAELSTKSNDEILSYRMKLPKPLKFRPRSGASLTQRTVLGVTIVFLCLAACLALALWRVRASSVEPSLVIKHFAPLEQGYLSSDLSLLVSLSCESDHNNCAPMPPPVVEESGEGDLLSVLKEVVMAAGEGGLIIASDEAEESPSSPVVGEGELITELASVSEFVTATEPLIGGTDEGQGGKPTLGPAEAHKLLLAVDQTSLMIAWTVAIVSLTLLSTLWCRSSASPQSSASPPAHHAHEIGQYSSPVRLPRLTVCATGGPEQPPALNNKSSPPFQAKQPLAPAGPSPTQVTPHLLSELPPPPHSSSTSLSLSSGPGEGQESSFHLLVESHRDHL
jgi:hypothetical protein